MAKKKDTNLMDEFPDFEEKTNEETPKEEKPEKVVSEPEVTEESVEQAPNEGAEEELEQVHDEAGDNDLGGDARAPTDAELGIFEKNNAGPGKEVPGDTLSEDDEDGAISDDDGVGTIEKPGEFDFQELCFEIHRILNSPLGRKVNCKLKIENPGMSAIIYQGLKSNVWGRIKSNGRHRLYRHGLKKLLLEDPKTATQFKDIN
jgi:hypothetical protein